MTATSSAHLRRVIPAAAIAATVVIGLGYPAITGAEREWDIGVYDECMSQGTISEYKCCYYSDGDWDAENSKCVAPPALESGEPQQSETPPVLQNPPGQIGPSHPLIPVPRGPSSGTVG